jgi:hypothetical protein
MSGDLIGKLVRWECRGQWFTARVTDGDGGSGRGSFVGEVVDPGNFSGMSPFATEECLRVGQELPNLVADCLTVIDEGGGR